MAKDFLESTSAHTPGTDVGVAWQEKVRASPVEYCQEFPANHNHLEVLHRVVRWVLLHLPRSESQAT